MKINGGIRYTEGGMTASLRAMHVQTELIGIYNENVTGFDKVGYQRKDPVISSFTEYIGVHGVSTATDDQVGRISVSASPLDFALASKGYFQTLSEDGTKITRDGRFKYDKEGYLLTLDDSKVLSNTGIPIKSHILPDKPDHFRVNKKGDLSVYNKETNKLEFVATLGVVDSDGAAIIRPDIKQGYSEFSNVSLQNEFLAMAPTVRNFEANRQLFMIQSQNLTKAIQQLGAP